MGIKAGDLIKRLFEMGQMVTINQALDVDSATIIASEYGFEIEDTAVEVEDSSLRSRIRKRISSRVTRW
ncbi:MAG: translation initiation factor IF-2 N-terminal domain-containing protein [Deltaproteobacteria bacterium]|nr:translation initiation factor IF-2 N-terminal domain-containing protein [Deltaproteobacteria bacterium]